MDNLEDLGVSLQLYFEQAISDGDVEAVRKLVSGSSDDLNSGDGQVNATPLFLLSVQGGNIDIIECVLQLRPPPNVHFIDDTGRRLLHFAAETGSLSVVKTLLSLDDSEVNVHVNMSDVDGRTPIMIAASKGYADITEFFIQKGGRLNEPRLMATGDSILHLAAQKGHLSVVEVLIKHGADVYCRAPSQYMWMSKSRRTVLHSAVLGGNTEVVKLLCANGADQSITDDSGIFPIHMAAEKGHIDMVRTFIDIGADINCQTWPAQGGWTVLHCAVSGGNTEIVKLLCASGADQSLTDSRGRCPIHLAAEKGHIDMVRTFIDIGADLEMRDRWGSRTALSIAALGGSEELVAYLLTCGADVAAVESNGAQSIHYAAETDRVDIVEMLINHGADVDAECNAKVTPLMGACLAGSHSVVEYLIAQGADVNKADTGGQTALHKAYFHVVANDFKTITEKVSLWLIAAGAKINVQNKSGGTPLHILANQFLPNSRERLNVIKTFVRNGAGLIPDIFQPSFDYQQTPLSCLVSQGFYEAARFMVLAGCDLGQENWLELSDENWRDLSEENSLDLSEENWLDLGEEDWQDLGEEDRLDLPGKSPEYNDFMDWLRSQIMEPKSLTWLCTHSIRRTLIQVSDGKEILSKVSQLPVPPPVLSFLNLEDI